MPIDLAAVSWFYVIVLAVLVFVSTLVGNLLSVQPSRYGGLAVGAGVCGLFVFWTYYPHGLPLPTAISVQKAAVAPAAPASPATPSAPEKPRNPVTTIPTPVTPAR